MSLFVLIPGAGGAAWYWHRVVPELRARGHEAVAVDLPGADESAGLPEYADAVVAAIGAHRDVVVARERLGTDIDVVPGGHLAALSRPAELTDQLIRYVP